MKNCQIAGGWYFSIPDNWIAERDSVDGHYLFYPPDSDLTLHMTPFHAGQPVPAEVMLGAFLQGIPEDAAPMDKLACYLEKYAVKGFAFAREEEGKTVYRRLVGYYGPGDLLSVGIFGTSEQECGEAVKMLSRLQKA